MARFNAMRRAKTVRVRRYKRMRNGRRELVREHGRAPPGQYRFPFVR
jgi:hypothetical protein